MERKEEKEQHQKKLLPDQKKTFCAGVDIESRGKKGRKEGSKEAKGGRKERRREGRKEGRKEREEGKEQKNKGTKVGSKQGRREGGKEGRKERLNPKTTKPIVACRDCFISLSTVFKPPTSEPVPSALKLILASIGFLLFLFKEEGRKKGRKKGRKEGREQQGRKEGRKRAGRKEGRKEERKSALRFYSSYLEVDLQLGKDYKAYTIIPISSSLHQ